MATVKGFHSSPHPRNVNFLEPLIPSVLLPLVSEVTKPSLEAGKRSTLDNDHVDAKSGNYAPNVIWTKSWEVSPGRIGIRWNLPLSNRPIGRQKVVAQYRRSARWTCMWMFLLEVLSAQRLAMSNEFRLYASSLTGALLQFQNLTPHQAKWHLERNFIWTYWSNLGVQSPMTGKEVLMGPGTVVTGHLMQVCGRECFFSLCVAVCAEKSRCLKQVGCSMNWSLKPGINTLMLGDKMEHQCSEVKPWQTGNEIVNSHFH